MTGEKAGEDRLAVLRSRFLERSRQDRAHLERALAAFAEGDDSELDEMHRVGHVLAGMAGTFGYDQVSVAADAFETALLDPAADRKVTLAAGRNLLTELEAISGDH